MRETWVYLSMKTNVLGTLLSPRWITELPTQPPKLFCVLYRNKANTNEKNKNTQDEFIKGIVTVKNLLIYHFLEF